MVEVSWEYTLGGICLVGSEGEERGIQKESSMNWDARRRDASSSSAMGFISMMELDDWREVAAVRLKAVGELVWNAETVVDWNNVGCMHDTVRMDGMIR